MSFSTLFLDNDDLSDKRHVQDKIYALIFSLAYAILFCFIAYEIIIELRFISLYLFLHDIDIRFLRGMSFSLLSFSHYITGFIIVRSRKVRDH